MPPPIFDTLAFLAGAALLVGSWGYVAIPRAAVVEARVPVECAPIVANGGGRAAVGAVGSRVVLEFFAGWCETCARSVPALERAVAGQRGTRWLSVSLDASPDTARRAASRWRLRQPVVWDGQGRLRRKYGIAALPATVVLRGDGSVALSWVGPLDPRVLAAHLGGGAERDRGALGGDLLAPCGGERP